MACNCGGKTRKAVPRTGCGLLGLSTPVSITVVDGARTLYTTTEKGNTLVTELVANCPPSTGQRLATQVLALLQRVSEQTVQQSTGYKLPLLVLRDKLQRG